MGLILDANILIGYRLNLERPYDLDDYAINIAKMAQENNVHLLNVGRIYVIMSTTYHSSREVSPARMAYLVSSAMLWIPSFSMICLLWLSTVLGLR